MKSYGLQTTEQQSSESPTIHDVSLTESYTLCPQKSAKILRNHRHKRVARFFGTRHSVQYEFSGNYFEGTRNSQIWGDFYPDLGFVHFV